MSFDDLTLYYEISKDKIDRIINNTSFGQERRRVVFKNGYQLSVITGGIAFTDEGEFEIAIFNEDSNFCPDFF